MKLCSPLVQDCNWTDAAASAYIVEIFGLEGELAIAWVAAGVDAIEDWDDVSRVVDFWDEHPDFFSEQAFENLCERFDEFSAGHIEWARDEADDENVAKDALKDIHRVSRKLGMSSPLTGEEDEKISGRFSDKGIYQSYREIASQPQAVVRLSEDDLISRLFSDFAD